MFSKRVKSCLASGVASGSAGCHVCADTDKLTANAAIKILILFFIFIILYVKDYSSIGMNFFSNTNLRLCKFSTVTSSSSDVWKLGAIIVMLVADCDTMVQISVPIVIPVLETRSEPRFSP